MITVNRRYAGVIDIKAPITNIVTADGPVNLKVRYTATEQLADDTDTDTTTDGTQHTSVGVIQINLPTDWKSDTVNTNLTDGDLSVSRKSAGVVIDGAPTFYSTATGSEGKIRINVDNMASGNYVELTVSNLQVPGFDPTTLMQTIQIYSEQYVPDADANTLATAARTDDADLDGTGHGHTPAAGHPMVSVTPRTLGTITKVPRTVTAEDELDLMIRYTATEELADNDRDLDGDGSTTEDEAILGRIQIELPVGWTFSGTDVTATKSSSVMFPDADTDPTTDPITADYLTIDSSNSQIINIDVDHMPGGGWVELTVSGLQVPEFDETQMTVMIQVLSERYYGTSRVAGTLAEPEAHAPRAGHPEIVVNERNRGRVTVSEDMVKADGPVDLTVRYTATDELAKPESATDAGDGTYGRIQVTLPESWGPENGYDLLNFVTLKKHSRVVANDLTEASITGTQSIGYRIDIDVNKMARGQWVALDFDGIQAPEFDDTSTMAPSFAILSDRYDSEADRSTAIILEEPTAHMPEAGELTITVEPRLLGSISRLRKDVTAEEVLDLKIRYTATEDLADPDPDGDEDTDDATYGTIQVMLPDGWGTTDGADLTTDDLTVTGSSSVEFLDNDDDLSTKEHLEVDAGVIWIHVDSLKDGKYVELTVGNLRVADFPDVMGDQHYVPIEIFSERFSAAADRGGATLETPGAHMAYKFSPKVAFNAATDTAAEYGSDEHPTIIVKRKYLGGVAVSPGSVVAEQTADVKIRYTATNNLATPDPAATATDPMNSTYGRIQVTLPDGWGPATDDGEIFLSRQTDNRDATYLSLRTSSGVEEVPLTADSIISTGDGYRINIDVNAMRLSQWVELTVHNLMIAPLEAERLGSFGDIAAADVSEKVQVEVFSDMFTDKDERDDAPELESPSAHSPVKGKFTPLVAAKDSGSDTQPTVKVTRKQLGKVAIAPAKVSAGSAQDFTITYTASEMLVANSVIEVRLPNWGGDDHSGVPTAYQLDDIPAKKDDRAKPNVHLSGSKSRLEGSTVTVQEDGDTSIVRIVLGEKGLAKNNSVTLKFEGVTVQRKIAEKVLIEVFSSDSVDLGVPQYPVEKPEEDKIEVTHAADGSGKVMFEFDVPVIAFDNDKVKSNTDASVPAGLTKDDTFDLIVTYMPEGDMVGESGTAEFQITLPGNWQAEDVRSSGSDVSRSGNTITAKLKDHFGEIEESLEIVLEGITTPDDHGNDRFVAKSRNAKGSLKTLNPVPMVFVGNTLADNDAMSVEIDPLAAYEGEEDVDFEITLTANGPMHDSDIRITVPDGIEGLQTGESGDPNYVRKVAPAGSGVVVRVDDANDENIFITTGKLNKGGTIIVRLNNVDIDGDVSTDNATGFRVYTRTRGTDGDAADGDDGDKHNLTDVDWELIEKADDARSIVGGEIRTITGSGAIAFKPATVQQGSQNVDFDFTFTASTAFSNKTLEMVAPSVIETPLIETAGDGQVTVSGGRYDSGVDTKDRLVVSDDTITVKGLILRKGERFAIKVNNVDLFKRTGDFRWAVKLDGTELRDADNPPMVVVGTTESDVAFEIVDDTGAPISAPEYNAASLASIRFRFTAENTVIQPGGTLRFTVPREWTQPSVTDRANRATVSIVHLDDDGNETFVAKVADKWALTARGYDVTLTIDPKGKLDPGSSVIIRYGTPDTTKYPVQISAEVRGTSASDEDGLSIRGRYKVSSATGFPERDAGRIFVDITNVKDSTGTATVTPPSVRADSTDNLIRVVYTAIGTMDGGAVRLTIPQNWGLAQSDDAEKPNYINVTVSSGAKLANFEVLDNGRFVQANLTTLGAGDNVSFTYGGGRGASKGAVAQADLGDAVFLVESQGSSGGVFEAIVDNMDKAVSPIVEVKSAKSGSGKVAVAITNNKSGSVVYDGVAERRIFAGDDKTYLVLTYTAEQTIAEGELELIVPSGWTAPQQDDTNRPGYTYLEEGNALVSDEEYNDQSVTATIEMDRGDVIKIHYGWYATENGGAHAPQAAGTYVFRVEFDGVGVAMQPMVIVHGGTASKLMVTAPSTVSADLGTAPVAITVEIQDDTNAAAVMGSDLEVTLSSTSSTGSFTDADGDAIVDNTVTISAGSTEATAYYGDTTVGTAMVIATAAGLSSGTASIAVTSDVDTVDENSISVSPATAKAGDSVTVTASGTAGKTATFSVGAVVTTMTMTESPANSGSYSGSFNVVQDQHEGTHNVTVNIGDASAMAASAVTVDTNAPTISAASASPATVGNGDMVTISATVAGATSVMADVSALDSTQTSVALTMANGSYSAPVTISADNAAVNGSKTITVTAMDAAGNSAMSTAMVTLDNKISYTSMIPAGTSLFHVPLDVDGLDTVGALKAALGNVSLAIVYDSAAGSWNSRSDAVMITADLGMILTTTAAVTHTFEGEAWGGGASTISLKAGSNLIGLPVNAPNVTNVSDIMTLFGTGVVASIVVSTDDGFAAVSAAGAANDGPVMGDAAYLVTATADATAAVVGTGWSHAATGAAPVALTGYSVGSQTPVLDVQGAVVDEITGLAREGFRVKVKNLSTKASLSKVTSVEMTEGYNMTFVDLKAANAARIGDVLEIFADSPNPLIGVKPVRHIVTVDDVKNSTIQLENLIAYEIPAETELLRNYPNPFNPETWIPYHLAEDADVKLTIYDVNGALVRDIDVGHQIAAKYDTRTKAIYWDGRNQFGEQVASGIYFYSLSAGDFSATRKMVILK